MGFNISLPVFDYPQGVILYQGKSLLNGKPIVVIATGFAGTKNPKTGNEIQTWILPADVNPLSTWVAGDDATVCGDCKHSSTGNGGYGTCYVNLANAPKQIWSAWQRGRYNKPTIGMLNYFKNRCIRIGSYGDPSCVPFDVWETVTKEASGWTGYTHAWRNPNIDKRLMNYCMASTDTERETEVAQAMGWRTFRMRSVNEPLMKGEFICPASKEGGERLTCETCKACHGGTAKAHVTIIAHGRTWKVVRFAKIMKLKQQRKGWRHLIPVKTKAQRRLATKVHLTSQKIKA